MSFVISMLYAGSITLLMLKAGYKISERPGQFLTTLLWYVLLNTTAAVILASAMVDYLRTSGALCK